MNFPFSLLALPQNTNSSAAFVPDMLGQALRNMTKTFQGYLLLLCLETNALPWLLQIPLAL